MMSRSLSPSDAASDVSTAVPAASRMRPAETENLISPVAPAARYVTSIDLSVKATPSYRSPLAECCLILLTRFRQPHVGDVKASIFVVSPLANAMLKSSMNARAVARTFIAMTSADVGGDASPTAALVGVPLFDGLGLVTQTGAA